MTSNHPSGAAARGDGRRWIALLLLAMCAHVGLGIARPSWAWTTTLGALGMLAVVFAHALTRAVAERDRDWWLLAAAFALWAGAFVAIAILETGNPSGAGRIPVDELFYALRVVPYLLIVADGPQAPGDAPLRRVDAAQAALLSGLLTLLLVPQLFGLPALVDDGEAWSAHYAINVFAAVLMVAAAVGRSDGRRRFRWTVAALLGSYALESALMGQFFYPRSPPPPPGSPVNVVIGLPLLLFLLLQRRMTPDAGDAVDPPRGPLPQLLPGGLALGSLLVGCAIIHLGRPGLGSTAVIAATTLFASRAALLQDRLMSARRTIAGVVEALPDAIRIVAADGGVALDNALARRLNAAAADGRPDPAADLLAADAPAGAVRLEDGRTLIRSEAALADGRSIVRLADVTRFRRIEREWEEAIEFLSHDLRAPLASIITLLDGADKEPMPRERLRRQAEQGLQLADGFIRLARLRVVPLVAEELDLADLIVQAQDLAWPSAQARAVRIETRGLDCPRPLVADGRLVRRALVNLLENAIRHGASPGTVTVGCVARDDAVELAVRSTGPELPAGRRDHVFARFGPAAQGGVGLAFVQAVAARHGGVATYAREGDHNVFTLQLPSKPVTDPSATTYT